MLDDEFHFNSEREVGDFNDCCKLLQKDPHQKNVINLVCLCLDGFTENSQKLREIIKKLKLDCMFMVDCKI